MHLYLVFEASKNYNGQKIFILIIYAATLLPHTKQSSPNNQNFQKNNAKHYLNNNSKRANFRTIPKIKTLIRTQRAKEYLLAVQKT